MLLSPAFLDELRVRTLLSTVIAPSVKLLRAGREWKACCPFHQEKTPSFTVNDEKGFYHCFGCGAHGDAIRFLTEARGLPFIDAVKELAGKAGLELPAVDRHQREKTERTIGLYDVMAAAQRWFSETLASSEGSEARAYLAKRGIDADVSSRFGLGLAPNARNRLKSALASFGEDKLVETGMLIRPDAEGETYDRFRGRLMIPIRDARGRVIAFGGRILGFGEPKYLNSPETVLFDKGRTLYNLDRASPASRTSRRLIVVEGYMDVIALDRAGIEEAVAPLGTALTESQIERLWLLDPAPICCFDGDAPGQKAAMRAALRALPLIGREKSLQFVTLPPGQDPDDIVASGGQQLLEGLLKASAPLTDFIWRNQLVANDTKRPDGRANLKYRLDDLAKTIADPIFREEYSKEFRRLFYDKFGFKKGQIDAIKELVAQTRFVNSKRGLALIHRAVLLGLTRYPKIACDNAELFARIPFSERKFEAWRDVILDAVLAHPGLDEDALQTILDSSDVTPIEKRDIQRDLAFSFFRRMADPTVAKTDLLRVMTVLVAEAEINDALARAHKKYRTSMDASAWEDQNLLRQRKIELDDQLYEFDAALAA